MIPLRDVVEIWCAEVEITLTSPALLSEKVDGNATDFVVRRHPGNGRCFITGESLAGLLRSELRAREFGYFDRLKPNGHAESLTSRMFGADRQESDGFQSPLLVDDAFADEDLTERRDHVRISSRGTASPEGKFDAEYVSTGTRFTFRFELHCRKDDLALGLPDLFATVLGDLQGPHMAIGARRSRGFGRFHADPPRVERFDLTTADGLLAWLERRDLSARGSGSTDVTLLTTGVHTPVPDKRHLLEFDCAFALADSVLIRSDSPSGSEGDRGEGEPDSVSLRRRTSSGWEYVLSGTSLAGVLRAASRRILNDDAEVAAHWGSSHDSAAHVRSSIEVMESIIATGGEGRPSAQVQAGIALDVWTGSVYGTSLRFDQVVVPWGVADGDALRLRLLIRQPEDPEASIGLALLLIKDLWTGEQAVGGDAGSGRGTLRGISMAVREWKDGRMTTLSELFESPEGLRVEPPESAARLESYVAHLRAERQAS